jgi:4-diphosphocytidyl-2-C-methyl-D-erythritol kinase
MRSITRHAPAKLNLMLAVTPETSNGKHLLTTVFTTISLADTLCFTFDDTGTRAVTIDLINAPDIAQLALSARQNIVNAAVEAMEKACGRSLRGHLHVTVNKRIPYQGGLAGGSTDAAATLQAIAWFWGMEPTDPILDAVAPTLGADVAFFLRGGCALMGGNGEKLLRRFPQPKLDLVLVKPSEGVSTTDAYRVFDADPQPLPSVERLTSLLDSPPVSPERLAAALANNLYPAACHILPALKTLVAALESYPGVHAALLAGSGSTVFGVCENARTAGQAARHFAERGYWARACTTGQ